MKKLWEYLSAVGLMFVAFLCLGIGLKTGEKAKAAYNVYLANGSTYTMSNGTISGDDTREGVYVGQGAKFIMNGGTINCGFIGVSVQSGGTFTMNNGTITGASENEGVYVDGTFNMAGGTIDRSSGAVYLTDSGVLNMTGGTFSNNGELTICEGGTFNYTSGTIYDSIRLHSGAYITLKKAPTSTLYIDPDSTVIGTKIAKLDGLTSLTTTQLSCLNVANMPADTQLEVQYVDGAYWVVVADITYTVTFKTNATITGGGWNIGKLTSPVQYSYTNANSVTLHFKKGGTVGFGGYYYLSNCVEGYNYGTITTPSGYSIDSVKTSDGTSVWSSGYPYPGTYTITGNTTITINFKYTITFEANAGGTVSQSSYDMMANESIRLTPNGAVLTSQVGSALDRNFSGVTATPYSYTYFMCWQQDGATMTNHTAVTVSKSTKFTAVFSSSTTVYQITIEKSLGTGVYAIPNPLLGTYTTYNVGSGGTLRVSGSQLTITPSTSSFSYTVNYSAVGTGATYTIYFTDSTGFTMSGTYTITSSRTITMRAKRSSFAAEQVDEDNGWQYDVEYVPLPWERGLKRNVCGFVEKI